MPVSPRTEHTMPPRRSNGTPESRKRLAALIAELYADLALPCPDDAIRCPLCGRVPLTPYDMEMCGCIRGWTMPIDADPRKGGTYAG